MRKGLLVAIAFGGLGVAGCAHVDEARADYHHRRAERAAEHGHYYKAWKEQRKANRAERDAETDPLP
jgi:hypothetical protein